MITETIFSSAKKLNYTLEFVSGHTLYTVRNMSENVKLTRCFVEDVRNMLKLDLFLI